MKPIENAADLKPVNVRMLFQAWNQENDQVDLMRPGLSRDQRLAALTTWCDEELSKVPAAVRREALEERC